MRKIIKGQLIDVRNREIRPSVITITDGIISGIDAGSDIPDRFILPPFIDAHVHIESSMLIPSEFARLAVRHGTVATVSDPHEIANVCGLEGVKYMIDNGKKVPFKFYFGASPCVPATHFETSGAHLDLEAIEYLLDLDEVKYLAEVMNYPAVLSNDENMLSMILAARKRNKVVDGHAPGLRGNDAVHYINAGISTDHECYSYDEALFKAEHGMHILIREGSAAKNFEALIPLMKKYPDKIMFCSDDKHPDDLLKSHINGLVSRSLAKGYDLFDTLKAASSNPVEHYKLEVGQLQIGDPADLLLTNSITDLKNLTTYIDGEIVSESGRSLINPVQEKTINNFAIEKLTQPSDFEVEPPALLHIIEAKDGQLTTGKAQYVPEKNEDLAAKDILQIVVINRYENAKPSLGYIRNFGIRKGAIASCVAHDSHNIIAVGSDPEYISRSVNLIIENKGGISAVGENAQKVLPLPVGGIMSKDDGWKVAEEYESLDKMAKSMGSKLEAPFMTLSFMALLVIPELKISDKGLFDVGSFSFLKQK